MTDLMLPEAISVIPALLLIFASFFTSAITAAVGVGGGLMMLALMTYVVPIAVIIPVHGLVQLGSNVGRTWVQREHISWPVVRLFLIGSILGAAVGVLIVSDLPPRVFELLIGLFMGLIVWLKFPALKTAGNWTTGMAGFVTTMISMFAGATGPLVAVFLANLFDRHRTMAATHAATMTAQHGTKILAFGLAGAAFYEWVPLVVAMVMTGYLGIRAGTLLMDRVPEKTLKLSFKIVITVISLDLIRRGLGY